MVEGIKMHRLWRMMAAAALSALPVTAVQAQEAEFFKYPDTVINGIDSAQLPKSLDECRKICTSRSGCAGFDYTEKGNKCRMFLSVGSAKEAVGSVAETRALISGYKEPSNPPFASRFEKLKQTDDRGDQLLALGREAFEHGDRVIGSQAINLAAERKNQDAILEIAKWYDPRTYAADKVAGVDANKAARSYFELAMQGNSQADSLLSSLCREANNSSSTYSSSFGSFLGSTYCEGSINP
jgi:hypothetical protein